MAVSSGIGPRREGCGARGGVCVWPGRPRPRRSRPRTGPAWCAGLSSQTSSRKSAIRSESRLGGKRSSKKERLHQLGVLELAMQGFRVGEGMRDPLVPDDQRGVLDLLPVGGVRREPPVSNPWRIAADGTGSRERVEEHVRVRPRSPAGSVRSARPWSWNRVRELGEGDRQRKEGNPAAGAARSKTGISTKSPRTVRRVMTRFQRGVGAERRAPDDGFGDVEVIQEPYHLAAVSLHRVEAGVTGLSLSPWPRRSIRSPGCPRSATRRPGSSGDGGQEQPVDQDDRALRGSRLAGPRCS